MIDAATYRFAPRHERGPLGLAPSQVTALSLAAIAAVLVVFGARQPLVGFGCLVLGTALAFTPIARRPAVSWLAPLVGYRLGRRAAAAPLSSGGVSFSGGGFTTRTRPPTALRYQLPGLGRCSIWPVATDLGEIAVAEISGVRSSAVTFSLSGPRFGLVETDAQARALNSWGQLLGALARDSTGLQRIQLTERLVPDDLNRQWRFLESTTARANPEARAIYRAELEALAGQAVRHEVLLTATFRGSLRGEARAATECGRLSELLRSSGFSARPLSAASLGNTLDSMLDPERQGQLGDADDEWGSGKLAASGFTPRSWRSEWASIRTESGLHAVFEATALPRQPVGPEWAWPLVLAEQPIENRTLTLHLELAPPEAAIRRAERAVVAVESDEAMRTRWGFRSGARHQQSHDAAIDREIELAAGFADARFSLLLSVSATSAEALATSARALVSQASQSQVELRRLYGRQSEALVATLPLGAVHLSGGWR